MITIRKLAELPAPTRRRKIVRLLESWMRERQWPDPAYLDRLARLVEADAELPEAVRLAAHGLRGGQQTDLPRATDHLRHLLMRHLGIAPGDWDLLPPAGVQGVPRAVPGVLSQVELYLESIRSPFNLGSIIRTAAAFGIARIGMSDDCPSLDHPRVRRSAMGAVDLVEVRRGSAAELRGTPEVPWIALETGGRPCFEYPYPARGILMLGSEELGLSPGALALAAGRVSIPLSGAKASLNVGVAGGIALAAWQESLTRTRPGSTPNPHAC